MFSISFPVHLNNLFLVLYDRAFGTKLFQKDVEGMVSLFLARAGFESRVYVASLDPDQSEAEFALPESAVAQPFLKPRDRLSTLLDILNGGIKAIRSGEHRVFTRLPNFHPLISWSSGQRRRFTFPPRTLPLHICEMGLLIAASSL